LSNHQAAWEKKRRDEEDRKLREARPELFDKEKCMALAIAIDKKITTIAGAAERLRVDTATATSMLLIGRAENAKRNRDAR
jgi:hypothetical protein